MTSSIRIRLHVMSPLHIGCGAVYEPISFRVDMDAGKLYPFDPLDLIDALDDAGRNAFEKVCSGDNLLAIIKEVARLAAAAKVPPLSSVDMAKGLVEHYRKVLGMSSYNRDAVISQFTLERTAYNPNGCFPYIPGSSLKGAIRTAYLNFKNAGKPCYIDDMRRVNQAAKELEKRLLDGSFEDDPFRLLKVPDLLPVESPSTRLLYAVNVRKKGGEGKGPFQIVETISHGSVFEGILTLHQPPSGARVKKLPEIVDLLCCLNTFSMDRYREDKKVMEDIKADAFLRELGGHISKYTSAMKDNTACLVRIGRHGGAESHTLDGARRIKIKQQNNRDKESGHATTIWLAAEDKRADKGMPFGWAVLEMLPVGDGVNTCCNELRNERTIESGAKRTEARLKASEEAERKAAEEARLRQIEEERKKKEEEDSRIRAEWESLSEEERLVRTPTLPDVTEHQVVECFNKLDMLASPYKESLAKALKEYYVKAGKWDGGSRKQIEKVRKLKAVLGDGK